MQYKIIPVFTPHASCPQMCIFCNQKKISNTRGYNLNSIKASLERGVASLYKKNKKKEKREARYEIAFYGGSFTAMEASEQELLLELAKPYIDDGSIDSIRLSTRPDFIDQKTLNRLKKYHVSTIELGVQSMDDNVLRENMRGHTREDTIIASKMIKEAGFKLGHQIMPGLYKDTTETMIKTVEEVIWLAPDFLRVYPCLVIKGTQLEKLYREGQYQPLNIGDAIEICKFIYQMAVKANIKIIRMGLHSDCNLIDDGFVAGPFHPAFKHIVVSSLFYDLSESLLEKSPIDGSVAFLLNSRDVSNFVGNRAMNIDRLREKYELGKIGLIHEDGMEEGKLAINHGGMHFEASIFDIPIKLK